MAIRRFRPNALPQDATISAEEAAGMLGLSQREIYRDLKLGNIPAKKRGNRYVIYRADIKRLMSEGTREPTKTEILPTDVLGLLSALAGQGEVTFEVTVRRKGK